MLKYHIIIKGLVGIIRDVNVSSLILKGKIYIFYNTHWRPNSLLDYADDLYPDFTVNFEESTGPGASVVRPPEREPDFSVDFDPDSLDEVNLI